VASVSAVGHGGLPRVLLGIPYHRGVEGPFFQSVVGLLEECHRSSLHLRVAYAPGTAIHLARDNLVRFFLTGPFDYLVMVDSDQVFSPRVVTRLVGWGLPLVAPVIVNRLGEPKPVAYVREGTSLTGDAVYAALSEEVWAYLSRYRPERLRAPTVVLPEAPDHAPTMEALPDPVRDGLATPLLAVDAVGGGMVCLSRACAEAIDPGPDDRYFDWEHGGEDLSFCRRVLAAGYAGFAPDYRATGERHGVFVDRGCVVGHLTSYARGAVDLGNYLRFGRGGADQPLQEREGGAGLAEGLLAEGLLADLAEAVAEDGARATPGAWRDTVLPGPGRAVPDAQDAGAEPGGRR
jgi:hypothetical protein